MKKRPELEPLKTPRKSNETRWSALNAMSSIISGIGSSIFKYPKSSSRDVAFIVAKAWTICEPTPIPHPREEQDEYDKFLGETMEIGQKVFGETPLAFHSPMMVKCAFSLNDSVLNSTLAWLELKKRFLSLGPLRLAQCTEKLHGMSPSDFARDSFIYPFPDFIQRCSESLQMACEQDRLFVNKLHEITIKRYTKRDKRYRSMTVKRRKNILEMNRWASFMALLYRLCEAVKIERWVGLDAVTELFHAIGDVDSMERYCQVLDIETATDRIVEWNGAGVVTKLKYVLHDDEMKHQGDQSASEDELSFWHWAEKVLRELHRRGQECDDNTYDGISRILLRIDISETKTEAVRLALRDWHNKDKC